MKKKRYTSNWLSNVSVALVIVGGFQNEMPTSLRVLAIALAAVAYFVGRRLAKEDD